MKPLYAFIAAFLISSISGCASGKLQYPGDAPGTERYSQFCLVLDPHTGFTRCETNEVLCYQSGPTPFCVLKPPAPEAGKPKAEPRPNPSEEPEKAEAPKPKPHPKKK